MDHRSSDYQVNNVIFRVAYADITQIEADAVVSSDDTGLSMGGGVSAALRRAGGEMVRNEASKHPPLQVGDVAVTSAGNLPARYIFHAITIDYGSMTFPSEESIRAATLKCLQLADSLAVRRIAFPALGTGVGGFPFELAAEVMIRTVAEYLMRETQIELVTIALHARERVSESDLNLFYERAVALSAVSSQSKRLGNLLAELRSIIGGMDQADLTRRILDLENDLRSATDVLARRPRNREHVERLQEQSGIAAVSRRVVEVSTEAEETIEWKDRRLEVLPLRTKREGLFQQLNVYQSNLNKLEVQRARYGLDVPVKVENEIEDTERMIETIQQSIKAVDQQLASLHAGR